MTTYNGMDIHHYPNRTEIHLDPCPFKIGQRVKVNDIGKAELFDSGFVGNLDGEFKVVGLHVNVAVSMYESADESKIFFGRWRIGIKAEGAARSWGVYHDGVEAVDHEGRFTLGAVLTDPEPETPLLDSIIDALKPPSEHWIECDYCGGRDVEGIGMAACSECGGEGTLDNGMSCHVCDGTGEVECPYCNTED